MRVDKFLKVSRVIKRRTVGKELALKERIKINDRLAKPSSLLKVNDIVEITLGDRMIKIKILDLTPNNKNNLSMYEVISETFTKER